MLEITSVTVVNDCYVLNFLVIWQALNRNAKNKCPSAEIAYKSWNTMLTDGYLYLQLTIVLIFLNIWSWELKVYLIGSLLIVTKERSVPLE